MKAKISVLGQIVIGTLTVALAGCSGAQGDGGGEACTAPPFDAEAAAAAPGQKEQGRWANAGLRQGRWANGLSINTFSTQGFWRNAIWSNGRWNNGAAVNAYFRQGTELGFIADDGTVIGGADVVGGELELVSGERLKIESFEPDPADPEIAWYVLTYEGENVCGDGVRGMFVPGLWDPATSARMSESEIPEGVAPVSFSCSTGVLAKCVTWGYKSWAGEEGAELHQACTRMARADYCGDGIPHTENGTLIDVLDVSGIQQRASKPGEMEFEAAWGPDGAVCVNQTRYFDQVVGMGAIEPSCWATLPRCTSLEQGAELGAKLGNYSEQKSRTFCEAPGRY